MTGHNPSSGKCEANVLHRAGHSHWIPERCRRSATGERDETTGGWMPERIKVCPTHQRSLSCIKYRTAAERDALHR